MSEEQPLEDVFDLIHRKMADRLLELLEGDEPLTAQELNAISKFLSDNNITGIRDKNKGLSKLSEGFAAYAQSTVPRSTQ